MCRVLNMSEFWIFVNFRKYNRILNMRWDAIMRGSCILHDSEYTRFLLMQTLHKVLNKYPVLNMPGLRIWQGSEYGRVTQSAE